MSRAIFQNSRALTPVFGLRKVGASCCLPSACASLRCLFNQTVNKLQQDSPDEGTWLHKLDDTQKMFLWGHRHGTRFGLLKLTLNSKKPLSTDVLEEAMLHWHRKTPVFQGTIREKEGDMWFYRPHNDVDIDFKVYGMGTKRQDVVDDCFSGFDEFNGPLWKARLLPLDMDTPCLDPSVKKDFPHQYDLGVAPHHSITDGRTLLGLIQPLIDIINDVIEGNDVDDGSPLGVFVSNDEYGKAYSAIKEKLLESPERLERLRAVILKSEKTPLLAKCFPRPDVTNPTSRHKYMAINQEQMARFFGKCKAIGITGGTGMQMITNTALVELAQEAGATDHSYDLSANFTIDLRRYLQPRELLIHGCHAQTMASLITVDKNVRDNFWNNCRALHEVNLDLIKGGKVVKQAIGRHLFMSQPPPEEFFKSPPDMTRDYAFNNLRSIDRLIHGRGKHVHLTELSGFNAIQGFIFPFMQMIYDYRGAYVNLFSYATDWMTEDNVVVMISKIRSLLEYYSQD